MENRTVSIVIIVLCALSIIVGINTSLKQQVVTSDVKVEKSKIKSFFSAGKNKIALVTLEGAISSQQSKSIVGDLYSAESVHKALKQAKDDNSVKGILIRVNSPGGTVAMSQEIYNEVLRIRKEKPVVVSMADVAASGGYYIASAADRIIAAPGTLTGSVGVIFNNLEISSLADKIGINSNVIKSGKYKDIGSMYKKMSTEEKQLLQSLIDQTYEQFVSAIKKGRIQRTDKYKAAKTFLTEAKLRKYADGRIFTGEQAKGYGFVDSLGGAYEAHQILNEMAKQKFNLKEDELPLVSFNKPSGISNIFFNMSESVFPVRKLGSMLPFSMKHHHKPLYLWE